MNSGEILKQWLAVINGHDVLALTALNGCRSCVCGLAGESGERRKIEGGWLAGIFRNVSGLPGFAETM